MKLLAEFILNAIEPKLYETYLNYGFVNIEMEMVTIDRGGSMGDVLQVFELKNATVLLLRVEGDYRDPVKFIFGVYGDEVKTFKLPVTPENDPVIYKIGHVKIDGQAVPHVSAFSIYPQGKKEG